MRTFLTILAITVALGTTTAQDNTNEEYFQKTVESYKQILAIDSNHLQANYNLGMLYIKRGEHILKGKDLESIKEEEGNTAMDYFRKGTPYFERACNLNPNNKNYTELIRLFRILNNEEKAQFYQKRQNASNALDKIYGGLD